MNEILDKISSYNIFNYLFPGTIFAVITTYMTPYNLVQENLFVTIFLYYFFGLLISRIGSLILEPILKKFSFVQFSTYEDFVTASAEDEKLEVLSEANNMYRTLCSLFLLILGTILYAYLEAFFPTLHRIGRVLVIVILFVMFLAAYRKQTKYITDRIKAVLK